MDSLHNCTIIRTPSVHVCDLNGYYIIMLNNQLGVMINTEISGSVQSSILQLHAALLYFSTNV